MKKSPEVAAAMRRQWILQTCDEGRTRYINTELYSSTPCGYLTPHKSAAVVYSDMDSAEDKVAFWERITGRKLQQVRLEPVCGLVVGDRVEFEDLELSAIRKGKVAMVDGDAVTVTVGKSLRVYLKANASNGRYYCPQLNG